MDHLPYKRYISEKEKGIYTSLRPGSKYNASAAFCFVSSSTVTADSGIEPWSIPSVTVDVELWSIPPSVTVDDDTLR